MKNKKIGNIILVCASVFVCLLCWELIVTIFKISPIVLVRPTEIFPVIINNIPLLLSELGFTLVEAFFGWLIGSSIALLTASIIFSFRKVTKIITSASIVINAVPLIALSAILGGFIGTNQNSKTVIVALLCYFPILIVSLTAFTSVDENYLTLFKTYNSSPWQRFFKLIMPYSLPVIFSSIKVNVVLAMTTAIVSEFFGAHGGIGQFILARKGFYDLPMVWAAIFFTVLGGTAFYGIVGLIQKKFIYDGS